MGYLHIDNLYKDQTILIFKECYALEKIHGTSAHIAWKHETKEVRFFSGGESHANFVALFDKEALAKAFEERFQTHDAVIYGEAYGGKQQGMSATYGKQLKFVVFDVRVGEVWLGVENAASLTKSLGLEFVDYVRVSTDVDVLNAERDRPSVQAMRNGCGDDKMREGIVLRPIVEFRMNNGRRIISKHKRDDFRETKTPREVSPDRLKVQEDAKAIAEEWVTDMRLTHVLDKFPADVNVESMREVIGAMIEDVLREGKGEFVDSPAARKYIASRTAMLFKERLKAAIA